MRTCIVVVTIFLSWLGTGTVAAEVEVTPFAGYRFGGLGEFSTGIVCIRPPCPSFARSRDGVLFGVFVDVPVSERLQVEVMINHQPTELSFSTFPGGPPNDEQDLAFSHLHLGLLRQWGGRSLAPFGVFSIGLSRLDLRSGLLEATDDTGLSVSFGGGVKIYSTGLLGFRFDARGYWVDVPAELGGDVTQIELTSGAVIRW